MLGTTKIPAAIGIEHLSSDGSAQVELDASPCEYNLEF